MLAPAAPRLYPPPMTYLSDVPVRVLDLDEPPAARWRACIEQDREVARNLLACGWSDAMTEAERNGGVPRRLLELAAAAVRGPFQLAYRASGGRHLDEIRTWARALDANLSHLVMMQCMYELSHLAPEKPAMGCSAGARWFDGFGMVHTRTLDWAFAAIGPATRIFEWRRGTRRHYTVGMPGMVGALSGMVPGGYSVTINWAPPVALPFFFLGPLFELRACLETCDTYAAAVERLRTSRLASSVFFTVCGTKRGEACVIERLKTRMRGGHLAAVREAGDDAIAQSNHYQSAAHARFNPDFSADATLLMRTTRARADRLAHQLRTCPPLARLEDAARVLDVEPVCNAETRQKMVFCPATGELRVWREVPG